MDASETIQEKTSLSDRFGLRIPYLALNQAEFLELVEGMAEQAGIRWTGIVFVPRRSVGDAQPGPDAANGETIHCQPEPDARCPASPTGAKAPRRPAESQAFAGGKTLVEVN